MRSTRTRRVIAGVAAFVTIAAGLLVHVLLPDSAATDIAGDVLYTVLIYELVVVLAPRLPALVVGAITAGWCVAIELFQLTGIPNDLGAVFPPAVLVLGTVFDARDVVVGVLVSAAATGVDAVLARAASSRAEFAGTPADDAGT